MKRTQAVYLRVFLFVLFCALLVSGSKVASALGQPRLKRLPHNLPFRVPAVQRETILRVLSYNVHGLPLPWEDTSHFKKIGIILKQRRLQGNAPHIVAIQEGFHAETKNLFEAAGYPYIKHGPLSAFAQTGSGLHVMSEYPLSGSSSIVFDKENTAGFDWNSRKGVHYVRVALPGIDLPLELFNTHLQADYPDEIYPSVAETVAARRRQIVELQQFFWQKASSSGPVIFVGDFNAQPPGLDYWDLIGYLFLTNAAESCAVTQYCSGNINPWYDLHNSVDHQFYRAGTAEVRVEPIHYAKVFTEKVNGKKLSDHDGLEVHYRLTW